MNEDVAEYSSEAERMLVHKAHGYVPSTHFQHTLTPQKKSRLRLDVGASTCNGST